MENKKLETVLPTYAGMIHQEHSETVVKLLTDTAVDYRVSRIGCGPMTMAVYAKFNSIEDQKKFEAAVTPYQFVQWS